MSEDSVHDIDFKKFLEARVTRRDLLKDGVAAGALLGLGPIIAACGGSTKASTSASTAGTPKTGGILNIGLVGGTAADTADPQVAPFYPDQALAFLMFEGLVQWLPDYSAVQNVLAEEVAMNADATEWTVRLKPDVLWHDGKPLTADDVVFSFRRIVNPKKPLSGVAGLGGLTSANIVKVDAHTVKFLFDQPNVIFGTDGLANRLVYVVPVGFNPQKPIGTGAFKAVSLNPGVHFVLSAFKDYHGGSPYVDQVVLTEFADSTARVNALLGGTVDAIIQLPPTQYAALKGTTGFSPLNAKGGGWVPLCMRVDVKPFDDVRVRQAFRLIADRPQILANAYSNIGWLANDMYSPYDRGYPHNLPQRHQDLEQAKSLLKAAGYGSGLTVELVTSSAVGAGAVPTATVFAQQATGAGVTVKVNAVDSSVIYGKNYLSWPFTMDFWGLRNYIQQAEAGSTPTAPYNETHWKNDRWLALVNQASRTIDDVKRNDLIGQAETIEYNEGGYIITNFTNQLDAYNSSKLAGFVTNDVTGIPLGRWRLNKVYFK